LKEDGDDIILCTLVKLCAVISNICGCYLSRYYSKNMNCWILSLTFRRWVIKEY